MTDPIASMLTQIRNASAVGLSTVDVPFSKLKYEIAKILEKNGLTEKTAEKKGKEFKKNKESKRVIEITLKYDDKESKDEGARYHQPVISGLRKVSKPGQRIYLPYQKIKKVKGGYGISIVSTSKGLMTDKETRKQKIGGEIICEVW